MITKLPIEERFFKKVNKTKECWFWIGQLNFHGYGVIHLYPNQYNDKKILAHRLSYKIHKGEIPKDMCVRHSCDIRNCVNPNHLWIGTKSDNHKDMWAKGRQPDYTKTGIPGENHPMAKLTWKKVNKIRKMLSSRKYKQIYIAKIFNAHPMTISNIIHNKQWKI